MATVKFTTALKRFFPTLEEQTVEGVTLKEVLSNVEKKFPGITSYLLEDSGKLRKHVNIFVHGQLIEDRAGLTDRILPDNEVIIFQALSGG